MALANTNRDEKSAIRYVDWFTIALYLVMVAFGALSIYAASYDFDHASIFSFTEFSGKQFRWIALSVALGTMLLLIDARIYETYAYPLYAIMLLLLLVTIFVAPDIKGSHSWLVIGPMSLQPAEFAKTATALALAKLFSGYGFSLSNGREAYIRALAIIFVPVLLILAQNETGSALAYMALFFVLYREGMSGMIMMAAFSAVVFFVVAIKFGTETLLGISMGQAIVMWLIMGIMTGMVAFYGRRAIEARNLFLWFAGSSLLVFILHLCGVDVPGYLYFITVLVVGCGYCIFVMFQKGIKRMGGVVLVALASLAFLFSVDFAFEHVLQPHQQQRINVALGVEQDLRGAGYNVNQAKIAIGSGGVFGKGFLNGTQTKLKYVPEQHTDFIYCTIGEEEGFVGSVGVLLLFLMLILRVIRIAERQPSAFGRVYGYCVASYFIFHLCINVGMVIGLCPVIGIPLPFFSYGGSSLWGFTFLLFILLRIDAARRQHPSYN